jgi:hypothetical protein
MRCFLELLKTKKLTFKSQTSSRVCDHFTGYSRSKLIHHAIISNGNVSRNDSNFMRNLNCNPLKLSFSIKGQSDINERWLSFSTTFFLIFDLSRFNYGPHGRRQCRDSSGKVPLILSSSKNLPQLFESSASHMSPPPPSLSFFFFLMEYFRRKKNILLI